MSQFPFGYFGGFGFPGWQMPAALLSDTEKRQADTAAPVAPQAPLDRQQTAWHFYSARHGLAGFDAAPPWSIGLAWQMRRYSAIVLAFAVTTAPCLAGTQTIEICPGAPAQAEDWKKKAEDDLLSNIGEALTPSYECLNFGQWLQEVIWDINKNGRTAPSYKSIAPESAMLYRDEFDNFAGYKLGQEFRDPRYAFLSVNDPHIDPIFGYARNENCREEWWRVRQSNANADRTERKASGIQMALGMPMGATFSDAQGNQILPDAVALTLTNAAARGDTFTYPLTPFSKQDIIQKPELADIPAVKIEKLDWGNTGPAILAQISRMDSLDKRIMRAWRRPERESMEGVHGTKAEAGTHGAIGTTDSELVHAARCQQWSKQVFNRYLLANFGEAAVDALYLKPAPLSDPQQEFLQDVSKQLAAGPTTAQEFVLQIDQRQLAQRTEIPLRPEEEVQADLDELEQQKEQNRQQMQDSLQGNQNTDGGAAPGYPPNGNGKKNGFGGRLAASADAPIDRLVSLMREIGTEPEDE